MEQPRANYLYITYVEKEGPFLKIWGQADRNSTLLIERVLQTYTIQFDHGFCMPQPESLQVGVLCCAKYKDNKYYRARITSLDFLVNQYIEVNFIDFGNKDFVPATNVRSLESFDSNFISIPPQANCFLLSEAVCPRGEWIDANLQDISKEIRFAEVNFTVVAHVGKHYLIRIFIGTNDLSILLISRGLMRHTSMSTQEAVLLSMLPRSVQQTQAVANMQPNIATYKAHTLEPGSQYPVYVSYVTEGPCNFSVQLQQAEEVLGKLMKDINSMNLTPLDGIPIPGTVCLARCTEDGHICRAVVTNEVDGNFKVFYVDFGNFEVVPMESLYEIPFKCVIPKVMAIRFALAGVEKSTVTLEMQCAFKQFVDNRLIYMKVMPMTTRSALPRCELWDPETNIRALDIIKQAATTTYPELILLNRGSTQLIKCSFVFSCSRFYVQLKSKEEELLKLMLNIQKQAELSDLLNLDKLKIGLPCLALFENDQQWYRSQIIEIIDKQNIKVQYIDYGNEEIIPVTILKPIDGKQLIAMKPQAIECCLNGYQKMTPDIERDTLLEELILEKEFTMKVIEVQNNKTIIELTDAMNYNVASLLLDRIATVRSQVSPLLVQAGNKIEHRKPQFNKNDRKPRDQQNNYSEALPENSSWRHEKNFKNENENDRWKQNKRDFRKSSDSNESPESGDTWRQNNKSFNKNFDRNANKSSETDNWGQSNNKGFNKKFDKSDDLNNSSDRGYQKKFDRNNRDQDKGYAKKLDKKDWSQESDSGSFQKNNEWKSSDKGFNKRENRNDEWSGSESNKGFNKKNKFDKESNDWSSQNNDKFNKYEKCDDWNQGNEKRHFQRDNNSTKNDRFNSDGGFKKRSDFKREGSTISSSDFESNSNKGFKNKSSSNFNKLDKPYKSGGGGGGGGGGDSWNATPAEVDIPNKASETAKYDLINVIQTESNIIISWFHNPTKFYCQLEMNQELFKGVMENIQEAYKTRKPYKSGLIIGQPIVGLFPEDNVLYRGEILDIINGKYKVFYVDFGNIAIIDKVWPIEQRFMELPAQAICCGLNGILPNGSDNWLAAKNYAKYFDKNQFYCKFLSNDNNKILVNLECNGIDLASMIVQDGLAVSNLIPIPNVEISILLGQQFKAMLTSVNNFRDFAVILQCGILLNCSLHNLAMAGETCKENKLKEKLGQILIVYVDNIIGNNRLEVTLYDLNGSLLNLIDQNDETFKIVESLCPLLILNSTLTGLVSYVENSTIFLQPIELIDLIEQLINQLYEYYQNLTEENTTKINTPEIGFIYAVLSSDENWYRARVVSFDNETNKVNVQYLDYGNTEIVELDAMRELCPEFMENHAFCIQVSMAEETNLLGKEITVSLTYGEEGWVGKLKKIESEPVPIVENQETIKGVEGKEEEKEVGILVYVSHTDSPSDFYIQLSESINAVEELQRKLQEEVENMNDLENPTIGVLCGAQYSVDELWYRAQVLDCDSDITTVRFVDFGNTDVLDNKTTKIKTLPPNLLSLELYATRCRLKIQPIDEEWSTAASDRFEELTCVDNVTVKFIDQDEKTNYVELYSNGENIKDLLIKENLAKADENLIESKCIGFVSHLNSPSEFWIQLENCIDELEWIAAQLSNAEKFPELQDFAPGKLCAALFPDDEQWYRARILSNTIAGLEVLFIDYGNSCTSCSLRELPEDLIMLPALAQKCSLRKPDDLEQWTLVMMKKFADISADGQTMFTVRKLTNGETAIVELLMTDNGDDVLNKILVQTKDCCVRNFENLNSFQLEINQVLLEGNVKLLTLEDVEWDENAHLKFLEINENGETVFQVEFLTDTNIILYLNGNDIRPQLLGRESISSPIEHSVNTDKTSGDDKDMAKLLLENIVDSVGDSVMIKNLIDDMVKSAIDAENEASNKENYSEIAEERKSDEQDEEICIKNQQENNETEELKVILITNKVEFGEDQQENNEIESQKYKIQVSEVAEDKDKREVTETELQENNIKDSEVILTNEIEDLKVISNTKNDTESQKDEIKDLEVISSENKSKNDTGSDIRDETNESELSTSKNDKSDKNEDDSCDIYPDSSCDIKVKSTSRPSSRCSGRFNVDDRVVPGSLSRPETPVSENNKENCVKETIGDVFLKQSKDNRVEEEIKSNI